MSKMRQQEGLRSKPQTDAKEDDVFEEFSNLLSNADHDQFNSLQGFGMLHPRVHVASLIPTAEPGHVSTSSAWEQEPARATIVAHGTEWNCSSSSGGVSAASPTTKAEDKSMFVAYFISFWIRLVSKMRQQEGLRSKPLADAKEVDVFLSFPTC